MERDAKKVLILTTMKMGKQYAGTEHERLLLEGCAALEKELVNVRCFTAAISEIAITVKDGVAAIKDLRNNRMLEEYSFVQFRNTLLARDHFMAVALYLEHHDVPFTDTLDARGTAFGKISQMVLFALHNVSVPDSIAIWPTPILADEVRNMVQPPFIMKANHGTKGLNNYLVKSWEQFAELLQEYGTAGYVAQPFISNDGDYRFLYMGDDVLAFYRQSQADTHLNNSSQGGQGTKVDLATCDATLTNIAARAMQIYGREIGGVDVLVDNQTNKPYILEVNDTPALFSGLFQAEKIKQYAQFIKAKIEE